MRAITSCLSSLLIAAALSSSADADERKKGFFIGVDTNFVMATDGSGSNGANGGLLLGYDILAFLSVEVSCSIGFFSEPYDAGSLDILGTLTGSLPLAHGLEPFVFVTAGGGVFQDEGDLAVVPQALVGGGIGLAWFLSPRNGLRLRVYDLFRNTGSVVGDFNTIGVGLSYRFTF